MEHLVNFQFSFKNPFVPLTTVKAILIIFVVGFIVYGNALFNGFVWDDGFQIVQNNFVRNGQLFYYFTHSIGPFYRPLMLFFYTLFFALFGLNAFFYHFIQISLHIVNGFLVFFVLRSFSKKIILSLMLALLYIIHPINQDTVAYIAHLQDVLFVFFGIIALLITINRSFTKYSDVIGSCFLFLSLLSKETGILFVIIYLLYNLFFRKGKSLLRYVLPIIALLIYLFTRFTTIGFIQPGNYNFTPQDSLISEPFGQRLLSIPQIIFFYLKNFILPIDLTPQYWYVKSITISNFLFPLIIGSFLFYFLFFIGKLFLKKSRDHFRVYLFFLIWFCLGIGFHLQLIPLDKTAANHWFYFPIIGLIGMLAASSELTKKIAINKMAKKILWILIILLFIFFSYRTINRNADWYDNLTLFSRDIGSLENVPDIHDNYGLALLTNKRPAEAIIQFKKADQLLPNNYIILYDLGKAYLKNKEYTNAEITFKKIIKLKNDYLFAYEGLLISLILQNKYIDGFKYSDIALRKWPDDPILLKLFGVISYKLNKYEAATTYLQKSFDLSHDPDAKKILELITQRQPLDINFEL